MRLLAISEHYFPRLGGTVSYVHQTLNGLAEQGIDAELLVPGPEPEGWLPRDARPPTYRVHWLNAGYPAVGDPTREQRYRFCRMVDRAAQAAVRVKSPPAMVHVLFGLFVNEMLDVAQLRIAGVPALTTVHNLPPMECAQIHPDATLSARVREGLRLRAVAFKNNSRLRRQRYDAYVVPSDQVAGLLCRVLPWAGVKVIGHGPTDDLLAQMALPASRRPAPGEALRLLTAGGYVPHKRQHLIPAVARQLKEAGLDIRWDVVGPEGRIPGYFGSIATEIQARGLTGQVTLHRAASIGALAALYDQAHLYVQPSTEEGFCLTALDAAAAGLPVIASPAGALPAIAQTSGGRLVPSNPAALAEAIAGFAAEDHWPDTAETARRARETFSWTASAEALCALYGSLLQKKAVAP